MINIEPIECLIKGITEDLFVGNITAAKSTNILNKYAISAIVNLSGETYADIGSIEIVDYLLPSQELLPTEHTKTMAKLETIAADIQSMRDRKLRVFVHCFDGKNKCVLAAGYYLVTKCGWPYASTIQTLETLFFTDKQRKEETEDKSRIEAASDPSIPPPKMSQIEYNLMMDSRTCRRDIKCLTMVSFARILRIAGGAKK